MIEKAKAAGSAMMEKASAMADSVGESARPYWEAGKSFGEEIGNDMALDSERNVRAGQSGAGAVVGAIFGAIIVAYIAASIVPDAIAEFTNNSLTGSEATLWSVGGVILAGGVIFSLYKMLF